MDQKPHSTLSAATLRSVENYWHDGDPVRMMGILMNLVAEKPEVFTSEDFQEINATHRLLSNLIKR